MNDSLPSTGFVRLPAILKVFPVCKTVWWQGVAERRYPQGHKLSARVTAWRVEDIRALLQKGGAQ